MSTRKAFYTEAFLLDETEAQRLAQGNKFCTLVYMVFLRTHDARKALFRRYKRWFGGLDGDRPSRWRIFSFGRTWTTSWKTLDGERSTLEEFMKLLVVRALLTRLQRWLKFLSSAEVTDEVVTESWIRAWSALNHLTYETAFLQPYVYYPNFPKQTTKLRRMTHQRVRNREPTHKPRQQRHSLNRTIFEPAYTLGYYEPDFRTTLWNNGNPRYYRRK